VHIDWVTVIAQAINFLILVYLLRRFLYRPIQRAMAERKQRIAAAWDEANAHARAAEEQTAEYRRRMDELVRDRERLLADAREEADALRRSLRQDAEADARTLRAEWKAEIAREQAHFLTTVRRQLAEATLRATAHALRELAGADLEGRIVDTFLTRLATLDDSSRKAVTEAARDANEPILVETAFPLDPVRRRHVTQAVRDTFDAELDVRYVEQSDVTCGIRISAVGQVVAWSLASYLDELDVRLDRMIQETVGDEEVAAP